MLAYSVKTIERAVELYGKTSSVGMAVLTLLALIAGKYRAKLRPFFAAALLFFTVIATIKSCGNLKDGSYIKHIGKSRITDGEYLFLYGLIHG